MWTLIRDPELSDRTLGRLFHDGKFICHTLEPVKKIPVGAYKAVVNQSPRFGRQMPILLNVAGRSGIRIHGGNKPSDSEGCILVAFQLGANNTIYNTAESAVTRIMQKTGDSTIIIADRKYTL